MDSVAEEGSLATFSVRFEGASSSPGMTGMVSTILLDIVSEFYITNGCVEKEIVRMFLRNKSSWLSLYVIRCLRLKPH